MPTHRNSSNTIDLVLTNDPGSIFNLQVIDKKYIIFYQFSIIANFFQFIIIAHDFLIFIHTTELVVPTLPISDKVWSL